MDALRLFLAIDIPPFAREKITGIQDRFKRLNLNIAWVKPANIHLTLKFLGSTSPRQVSAIKDRVSQAVSHTPRFPVSLGEVGVFPNLKNPRVLWVGLEDPQDRLTTVQKKIEEEMTQLGFPPEQRKFSPHLTLGRIKSLKEKGLLKNEVQSIQRCDSAPIVVSSVILFQSRLTPKGSIYTILEEFELNRSAPVN